jgi:ribosomal protein L32
MIRNAFRDHRLRRGAGSASRKCGRTALPSHICKRHNGKSVVQSAATSVACTPPLLLSAAALSATASQAFDPYRGKRLMQDQLNGTTAPTNNDKSCGENFPVEACRCTIHTVPMGLAGALSRTVAIGSVVCMSDSGVIDHSLQSRAH